MFLLLLACSPAGVGGGGVGDEGDLDAASGSGPHDDGCSDAVDLGGLFFGEDARSEIDALCAAHPRGVRAGIWLEASNLTTLDFPCLCEVTDSLYILDNANLVDLHGLEAARGIAGGIVVRGNPSLESLAGLPDVAALGHAVGGESQGASIFIEDNDSLTSLVGLPPGVVEMEGGITIEDNDSLASLAGLPDGIQRLGDKLQISSNPNLQTLEHLPAALTEVLGSVRITNNDSLRDLRGMPPFEVVAGDFSIRSNEALESLAGAPAELYIIGGDLSITYNPELRDLVGLPADLHIRGALEIIDNGRLVDLFGLPPVLEVGRTSFTGDSLRIILNERLVSLSGFPPSLTEVSGAVSIVSNPQLADLSGLSEVRSMGGLTIAGNPGLRDLRGLAPDLHLAAGSLGWSVMVEDNDGLESLVGFPIGSPRLEGSVFVVANDRLTNLAGLNHLEEVAGDVIIGKDRDDHLSESCGNGDDAVGNSSLRDLAGLDSLVTIGGTLALVCNESLTEVSALAALQSIGGNLRLRENLALSSVAGLGGAQGALRSLSGPYDVFCSPLLDERQAAQVVAEVFPSVETSIQLECP